MSIRSWFHAHGIHVTQTSQSLTGGLFTRTTKTPSTEYKSEIRPDISLGQPHTKATNPPRTRNVLQKKRKVEAIKESEKKRAQYAKQDLPAPVTSLHGDIERAWQETLKKESGSRFANSTGAQVYSLAEQIAWIRLPETFSLSPDAVLQMPEAVKKQREERVLQGTTKVVLLNAVTALCKKYGINARQAANALACLQHIDMLGAIAAPFGIAGNVPANTGEPKRTDGQSFNAADVGNAWRLAIELRDNGEPGFKLLKHLMKKPPPAHAQKIHVSVERQRDDLLHTYLKAAREKVDECRDTRGGIHPALADEGGLLWPDPKSLHSHINYTLNRIGAASGDPSLGGSRREQRLMTREPGTAASDSSYQPATIGGRILPPSATFLDGALKAVSNHLSQVQAHADDPEQAGKQITFYRNHLDIGKDAKPDSYRVLQKDCYAGRASAVHNGMYSKTSKLYRKNAGRAQKMSTWYKRAQDMFANDKTRWERFKRKSKQFLMPMKDKSPDYVAGTIIRQSPHRLKSGTDQGGIADGQSIRQDLIWNLEKAIEKGGGMPLIWTWAPMPLRSTVYPPTHSRAGQPAVPDNPDEEVLRQMVRLAILNHQYRFNGKGDGLHMLMQRHNDGDPLTGLDLDRVKDKVYEMFAGVQEPSDLTKHRIDSMLAEPAVTASPDGIPNENVQISPARLALWASDVGGPAGLHAAAGPWPNTAARKTYMAAVVDAYRASDSAAAYTAERDRSDPDWDSFVDGVNRTLAERTEEFRNGIDAISDPDETLAAQFWEDVVSRQKLGHKIEMKDGGWLGFKTQGISYILSRLLLLGAFGVGIDLRYQYGKQAGQQMSTSTGGNDVFAGAVKSHRVQAGLGVTYGPGHASKKADGFSFGLAGGTNVTPFYKEWAEMVGSLFRFPRVFSGLDSDHIRNVLLGRLLRKLKDPDHHPDAQDGGPWIDPPDPSDNDILIRVLHEFGHVSVGWLKSETKTYKGSGALTGVLGLKLGGWGPGLGAGISAELTRVRRKWRETGGVVNQKKNTKGSELKVSVSGVLNLLVFTLKALEIRYDELSDTQNEIGLSDLLDPAGWSGAFKEAFQDGIMASADIFRTGTYGQHTWIYHNDALVYTPGLCSFYQRVHKNAAAYAHFLVKRIEQLARDKARVLGAYEYYEYESRVAEKPSEALKLLDQENRAIAKEIVALLRELRKALKDAKPTQEFRRYEELPAVFLQMKNDLEGLIKSEMSIPGWEKNPLACEKIKDYQRQVDKLESLDYDVISRDTEYRFSIRDNVESKQKLRGIFSILVHGRERSLNTSRIDNLA